MQTCFKSTPEGSRVEACFVKKDLCLNNRTHYPNATWQTPYSYFVAGTQLNKLVSQRKICWRMMSQLALREQNGAACIGA